jgi:hypothetical protein
MLDPELIERLALEPQKNAPDVNLALAEEGHGVVLLSLVQCASVHGSALEVVAARIEREGERLEPPVDDDAPPAEPLLLQLDRALIAHPRSPGPVRDAVLARHADEPFFVLAAASHVAATLAAVQRAADWPARSPIHDRLWLPLIPPQAIPPLVAEEWVQDPRPERRELVARLWREPELLRPLLDDRARQVRRALASNPHVPALRQTLAERDPAVEVRLRAAGGLSERGELQALVGSARFAAALRALDDGGALAADVVEALRQAGDALDAEGACLAAQQLASEQVTELVRAQCVAAAVSPAAQGLAGGLGLRQAADDDQGETAFRELVAESVKALASAAEHFGTLTGKARLAAWIGEALAGARAVDTASMMALLCANPIASDVAVLGRATAARPGLVDELCQEALGQGRAPAALLQLAWSSDGVGDDEVLRLAQCVVASKRRGRDLPDDEIDLDPGRRDLPLLERVVLALGKRVVLSPRSALPVVGLDSRRVRYVLTAMPSWRGGLRGAMLGRVFRQRAGALSAGRSEARARAAEVKRWTERPLSDLELSVAVAVGHITIDAAVDRLLSGRHKVSDGVSMAHAVDARGALQGGESVKLMVRWATKYRGELPAALALWLLLERYDRERAPAMIASAVDSLAVRTGGTSATIAEALALIERRRPGRLDPVAAHSPHGKATVASAVARAYRAVGGLRDER